MTGATTDSMAEIRAQLGVPKTRTAFIAWFEGRYPTRAAQASNFADKPTLGVWQAFCASEAGQAHRAATPVVEAYPPSMPTIEPVSVPEPFDAAPELIITPQHFPPEKPHSNGHKPATQTALFDLLAQGLQEHGFKLQADLGLDRVVDIAREAARLEFERLIASKRFTSTLEIKINDRPPVVLDDQTPAWFPRALKLAEARKNCLLIGPAGSGKSVGARLIAKSLRSAKFPSGFPYTPISLSGGTDEGVLIGWLLPVGDGGRFEYVPSAFVDAYTHGGVVLLDEIDAADPNVLLVVNEALANGHFPVPLRREAPVAERHPDFVCLAAANTHGHGADRVYVGRNQLDGATLSRFRMGQINVDFDERLEAALYTKDVVLYGHRLRERCRAIKGWTRDVSTRDIATAHDLVQAGVFSLPEAFYQFFADWSAAELSKVDVVLDHTAYTAILR